MNTVQNRSSQMIRVHADLDLYGLSPYEFRLYAHIARRGECFASLETTAKICKMSVRKAQYALKTLEKLGLVQKTVRKGKTDIYELTPRKCWKDPEYDINLEAERNKVKASFAKSRASISRTINNENNEEEPEF
ncbi:helix-turn-helix domain-containing protein [[Phormidium ambiguum] IAM M-71]|uniref:Helix-turn-helix domain-containing protein n=1 Tax=[Phormidium ambiguum] IAM M-71 TaxID=454136 RepID=A0A1U7IS05_9CYAN|nr:helix-turn-helix domain-containing protein [Phormidium ambiguum]OKH40152.1 helix-turn-helix domain-containing protein [Phormidium ambiguum IAM M-71]